MPDNISRQWILSRAPNGPVTPDIFRLEETPRVPPRAGEVEVRVRYVSLDPGYRLYMNPSVAHSQDVPASSIGAVMFGFAIGEVLASRATGLQPGDIVSGSFGWREYATLAAGEVTQRSAAFPLPEQLGVLGVTGLTAYHGMYNQGQPRAGEVVLISAAAGAVGSIAGQIARIQGCTTVGIVGGPEKARWICETLGFDHAVDYKADGLDAQLRACCPDGVDLYFDNVGGELLANVLPHMKTQGRVVLCGFLSLYDDDRITFNVRDFMTNIISRELQFRGINVMSYMRDHLEVGVGRLDGWLADGSLKAPMDIREGFESLPSALIALFRGENKGKMMVRL